MLPIIHLPDTDSQLIQSTISLPTYPSVLKELLDNAIDAQASHIDCWINPASWSIRVVDDGYGISKEDLKGQLGCARGMSSKVALGELSGASCVSERFLGFRGQALASMGTIASLQIISRRRGFATTFHKVIKIGKAVSCGPTGRHARASPGTVIILKDMYHSVPVRRNTTQKDPIPSLIQACIKVVETTILAFSSVPSVPADRTPLTITLTLEGNPAAGIPSRRLAGFKAGNDIVASFASIFGDGLTASSKSFRASAQGVHVRGFLSLAGHPTKAHQYLFVNGHHIAKSELYDVVGETYTAANVFGREIGDDEESAARGEMALQKSGKKGTVRSKSCFPVFLLHLEMPRSKADHSLEPLKEPLKNSVMFKDATFMQNVLGSVVKNVLRSSGCTLPKSSQTPDQPPSKPDSVEAKPLLPSRPRVQPLQPTYRLNTPDISAQPPYAYALPKRVSITGKLDRNRSASGTVEDARKGTSQPPEWLTKALADRARQVFPASASTAHSKSVRFAQPLDLKHDCERADIRPDDFGLERLQLTKQNLQNAKVIAQIDDKFICCSFPNPDNQPGSVLVLIDQHAADERIRVERFLRQVLREFKSGSVTATVLDIPHDVQLLKEQVVFLEDHPESQHLLERWGFQISQIDSTASTLLSVTSVPTLLLLRLGPKGGQEVRKIVSGYFAFLQSQPISSLTSLANMEHDAGQLGLDAAGLLRWMPERMKELVDSKACRGAIMFNDPLTLEKCVHLIEQLARLAPDSNSGVAPVIDWSTTRLTLPEKHGSAPDRRQ